MDNQRPDHINDYNGPEKGGSNNGKGQNGK